MLSTPGTPIPSSAGSTSTSSTATPSDSQHRLLLKQTHIDVWSIREQLGLASAVLRSGDQNWVSVSRQMKPFSEEGRPHDWFSQRNCALQYSLLLEKVNTPRRKRGDKMEAVETPGQAIVSKLKADRIQELKQVIEHRKERMKKLEEEVEALNNPSIQDNEMDIIEKGIQEEDQEEAERQVAHQAFLADREEKKLSIQAALKAQSAKVPLKGAAAQASIARRLSVQSDRNSFSDIDSPASLTTTLDSNPKPEVVTPHVSAEISSPLLSNLLKASPIIPPENPPPCVPVKQVMPPAEIKEDKMEVDEPETVVPETCQQNNTDASENNSINNKDPINEIVLPQTNGVDTNDNIPSNLEKVDETEVDQPESIDQIDDILVPNGDFKPPVEPEEVVQVKVEQEQIVSETETAEPIEQTVAPIKSEESNPVTKDQGSPLKHVIENVEEVIEEITMEKEDLSTATEVEIDSKSLSIDTKRVGRKPGRRSKQSEVAEEEQNSEDTPFGRRETRSKKTSERSEEASGATTSGATSTTTSIVEVGSEESPAPPTPLGQLAIRSTRRSAAKKAQVPVSVDGVDDLELPKEEKEEGNQPLAPENKRVSRLRDKEVTAPVKGRRCSGATTTSRSSSPVPSGEESESDIPLPRTTRTRRHSGKPAVPPQSETVVKTEDNSPPDSPICPEVWEPEEEWQRIAMNILTEVTRHILFRKILRQAKTLEQVVLQPRDIETLRKNLEDGTTQNAQEFQSDFLLMLVNFVMDSDEDELATNVRNLYLQFSSTLTELLLSTDDSSKPIPTTPIPSTSISSTPIPSTSIPSTPAKSTPIKSTPQPTLTSKTKKTDEDNPLKKTRGDKRDATGQVVSSVEERRKRGSLSSSAASEEPTSIPGTPNTKKRKRI